MSGGWLLLLYIVGLALVMTEVALPGVVIGLVGLGCLGTALYYTFAIYGIWSGVGAGLTIAGVLAAVVIFALRRLTIRESQDISRGYTVADPQEAALEGAEGEAATPLRPSGAALIRGRRVDVVTRGELVEKGARVRVIDTSGNRVVVKAV
jgi:membrane-bound serine protease (ClpP class)